MPGTQRCEDAGRTKKADELEWTRRTRPGGNSERGRRDGGRGCEPKTAGRLPSEALPCDGGFSRGMTYPPAFCERRQCDPRRTPEGRGSPRGSQRAASRGRPRDEEQTKWLLRKRDRGESIGGTAYVARGDLRSASLSTCEAKPILNACKLPQTPVDGLCTTPIKARQILSHGAPCAKSGRGRLAGRQWGWQGRQQAVCGHPRRKMKKKRVIYACLIARGWRLLLRPEAQARTDAGGCRSVARRVDGSRRAARTQFPRFLATEAATVVCASPPARLPGHIFGLYTLRPAHGPFALCPRCPRPLALTSPPPLSYAPVLLDAVRYRPSSPYPPTRTLTTATPTCPLFLFLPLAAMCATFDDSLLAQDMLLGPLTKVAALLATGYAVHRSLSPPNPPPAPKTCIDNRTLFERAIRHVTFCSKVSRPPRLRPSPCVCAGARRVLLCSPPSRICGFEPLFLPLPECGTRLRSARH